MAVRSWFLERLDGTDLGRAGPVEELGNKSASFLCGRLVSPKLYVGENDMSAIRTFQTHNACLRSVSQAKAGVVFPKILKKEAAIHRICGKKLPMFSESLCTCVCFLLQAGVSSSLRCRLPLPRLVHHTQKTFWRTLVTLQLWRVSFGGSVKILLYLEDRALLPALQPTS